MWCLGLTTRAGTVVVSCTTGKYHDIALATGQYHRYCPGGSFDLRHRWDTNNNSNGVVLCSLCSTGTLHIVNSFVACSVSQLQTVLEQVVVYDQPQPRHPHTMHSRVHVVLLLPTSSFCTHLSLYKLGHKLIGLSTDQEFIHL